MPRRWRNVLTLVSAIVCVGSLLLVGRSFVRQDSVMILHGEDVVYEAQTLDGRLGLSRYDGGPVTAVVHVSSRAAFARELEEWSWGPMTVTQRFGIARRKDARSQAVVLPLWLVPIVTAIPPLLWWRKRRRGGGRGFAVTAAATVEDQPMSR